MVRASNIIRRSADVQRAMNRMDLLRIVLVPVELPCCGRTVYSGFGGLHGLRLIVDDLAGSELGFELVNDLRVHLLVDLDLERAQGPEGGMPTGNRRLAPQMTNPMEICLADEVRKALRAECCGAALVLALTISAAYGKIAFPEEKVGKRYKEWYRRYCGYGFGSR